MNAILRSVEQATPDCLTALLRKRGVMGNGHVVSVEKSKSVAWNSSSYHLEVSYTDDVSANVPRRLFLKMSLHPEWGKEEVEFYRFADDKRGGLPMLAPCYDAAYSEEDGMSHLLLADLSATHFTPVTKQQLLAGETMSSQEYLDQMVDAISGFHAYWWEHPRLGKGFARIRSQLDGEDAYKQYTERREKEWSMFVEQAGHLISADVRGLYEKVLYHFSALWDMYLADRFGPMRRVTLSNGDCYFIQFLCPRTPGEETSYLIDFDSVSTNLPAFDLVYMFATFWTPEQRKEAGREEKLLQRYHNALQAHGISGYSLDDLMADYRLCVLYMIFDPVWDQTTGASEAYWLPKLRCLTGAFEDLDCFSLLPQ